jgi:hypothetical protein
VIRRWTLWLAALAVVASASPTVAQERPDTVKTREQQILERLKANAPLIKRDTTDTTTVPDSLAAAPDEVRFRDDPARRERIQGLTELQRDSIMNALVGITGFIVTEYAGDSARFDADSNRLDLKGKAEVVREGQRLVADTSIVYYEDRSYACAYGNPVVSGAGVSAPIQSDSLCYDLARNVGVARGARTEVSQGAVWYVSGDLVNVGENVFSHDAIFTDCSEDEPHYHFGAGQMKVISNNILVARNVTLRFADVPVFWLPFFVQSLSSGRRTGLLMPRFGINDIARTNARYSRRIEDVGMYFAISEYMGAEVAMDWQSQNWTALRGSMDYRFNRQFFSGAFTFRRFWKSEGGTDLTLVTNNDWQPDERTRLSAYASYATSSRFVRSRSIDPRELNRSIDSNVGMNRRFDWGTMSLSGKRQQFLHDNSVRLSAPSLTLNLSSVTLFPALPGEERWYNNATWTANGGGNFEVNSIDNAEAPLNVQGQRNFRGNVSSSFRLGKFSVGQGFDLSQRITSARTFESDTIDDLLRREERNANWNTSLNFQQRLIGTSSFTPGLSLSGQFARDSLDGAMVAGPTRLNFNSSLNTDVFGFFPGFGPFEALRHRLSPNFAYTYSPEPTVDERQRRVFGIRELRETNRISIGLNQTFEAKYKPGRGDPQPRAGARPPGPDSLQLGPDSLPAGPDTLAVATQDTATGPRRRETGRKITLLSISTDALVYDWVQAREAGEGIQTLEIGNNIQSDLLRGLQLSFAHSLFRRVDAAPVDPADPTDPTDPSPVLPPGRDFSPHLSRVSAGFSISSDSWIARTLRLGPRQREEVRDTTPREGLGEDDPEAGPAIDRTQSEEGLLGTRRRVVDNRPPSQVGTWNASLNYSLTRPRPEESTFGENQMVMGNLRFQATENWALAWNTGYSFTTSGFTDHALTLTRRLHDFDANFDFFKAQNGNFSFQFRVHLRANPDLKVDYEQRDLPAVDPFRR